VDVHVASQQLDLQRHNCLAYPDHGKDAGKDQVLLVALCSPREEQAQQQAEDERAPEVPVAQALAHAALQNNICVRPSPCNVPEPAAKAVCLAALCGANASPALHDAAQQVLGVQHLLHLLPDGEDVAGQRVPYRLVDGVCGRTAVFAGDARRQVRLRLRRVALDVARQRRAVRRALERIVEVIEGSW